MIDDAKLAEWKRLAEAATPGPWSSFSEFPPATCLVHVDASDELKRPTDARKILANVRHDNGFGFKDADFIAESREAVPALIAEVEYLRAIVRDLAASSVRDWEFFKCIFCKATYEPHYPEDERAETEYRATHAGSCPWRRAVEAVKR